MEQAFIKKRDDYYNGYHLVEATSIELEILGTFLAEDVGSDVSIERKFLDDPWSTLAGGNYGDLIIIGENISISCNYFPDEPDEEVFETTVDEFHYILDRWEELYKQNPHEIIITRENGTITLECKNS